LHVDGIERQAQNQVPNLFCLLFNEVDGGLGVVKTAIGRYAIGNVLIIGLLGKLWIVGNKEFILIEFKL